MLHDLNIYVVGRIVLAGLLGGAVGLERELSRKPAGIRTNMLICLGACLFTIISYEMASNVGGDHTRIAAQIIPGIGFIGAGVVIRERGTIIGITSAATIFVVASIGTAVGAGLPVTAVFTTLLLLASLVIIGNVEERVGLHSHMVNVLIETPAQGDVAVRIRTAIDEIGIRARRWHSDQTDKGMLLEFEAEVTVQQERDLVTRLAAMNIRCEVRPISPVTAL